MARATYASAIASANAMLKRKGIAVVLSRVLDTVDPVSQARSRVESVHSFYAVGLPAGKSAEFRVGSLVDRNVIEFYMAQKNQTVVPEPGDTVTFGGHRWRLLWSVTYDPDGTSPILSKAYAER